MCPSYPLSYCSFDLNPTNPIPLSPIISKVCKDESGFLFESDIPDIDADPASLMNGDAAPAASASSGAQMESFSANASFKLLALAYRRVSRKLYLLQFVGFRVTQVDLPQFAADIVAAFHFARVSGNSGTQNR